MLARCRIPPNRAKLLLSAPSRARSFVGPPSAAQSSSRRQFLAGAVGSSRCMDASGLAGFTSPLLQGQPGVACCAACSLPFHAARSKMVKVHRTFATHVPGPGSAPSVSGSVQGHSNRHGAGSHCQYGTDSSEAASSGEPALPGTEWEDFRRTGKVLVDWVADYRKSIESLPVLSEVAPGYLHERLPKHAPEDPESVEDILRDVSAHIVPGVTHWQHPSFFAYFPANQSPPAMLGDMLSSAFGCIAFSWVASPAATELEVITVDWLGQLIGLPPEFLSSSGTGGGVIQGTASQATLVALLAAKARALKDVKGSEDFSEASSKLVAYSSDQAHSSVLKAGMIAGIDMKHRFRSIPTSRESDYRMDPEALAAAMKADRAAGLTPFFCCATVGTTSSCAFDDLRAVGGVCQENGVWMHVDAAYAGSALICEEYRHLIDGVELADSFDFNPHKWLLVSFDCSTMWVKQRHWVTEALSITPQYLRSPEYDAGLVQDYRDWEIPLGRRFRSLKLWFVLRAYGAKALREYIRRHCALATEFAELVRSDSRFELSAPPALGLVCFRLKASNAANEQLLARVNASGKLYMVNTVLDGEVVLRCAIGAPGTQQAHVRDAWSVLADVATSVLQQDL